MPIPVKVSDNTHTIRVHTNSSEPVHTRDDCKVEKTRIDALITAERQERQEADEALQQQIDTIDRELDKKQDKIEFVSIPNLSGTLKNSQLNLLVDNLVNRLVFNGAIYYLTSVDGSDRIYSTTDTTEYNEITVNIQTGHYSVITVLNPYVVADPDPESDDLMLVFRP